MPSFQLCRSTVKNVKNNTIWRPTLQSSPVVTGGFSGLSPPKQSSKPPQIERWSTINYWNFLSDLNVKHPWTNVKSPTQTQNPLLTTFWRRFCFRDNWGWHCTAVHMWLVCSNRKLYKKTIFCYRHTTQQSLLSWTLWPSSLHKSSIHICIEERYMSALTRRWKRTPFRKNVLNDIWRKTNLNCTTWMKFCDGSFTVVTSKFSVIKWTTALCLI